MPGLPVTADTTTALADAPVGWRLEEEACGCGSWAPAVLCSRPLPALRSVCGVILVSDFRRLFFLGEETPRATIARFGVFASLLSVLWSSGDCTCGDFADLLFPAMGACESCTAGRGPAGDRAREFSVARIRWFGGGCLGELGTMGESARSRTGEGFIEALFPSASFSPVCVGCRRLGDFMNRNGDWGFLYGDIGGE